MPHHRLPSVRFTTITPSLPAATASVLDELRRARAELERLHDAFDSHRGPDSDRLRVDIRVAEQKIAAIRSRLKDIPDPSSLP